MPEIYAELTPPTSITHSLTLPFTSSTAANLVVAKTNVLQIFTTISVQTELTAPAPGVAAVGPHLYHHHHRQGHDADEEQGDDFAGELALQRSKVEEVAKLVLVAEFTLAGEVTGLARIAPPQSPQSPASAVGAEGPLQDAGDVLLVAVRDAKMSLLAWDRERLGVETLSLHYYEREEFWNPIVNEGLPSLLIADPGHAGCRVEVCR